LVPTSRDRHLTFIQQAVDWYWYRHAVRRLTLHPSGHEARTHKHTHTHTQLRGTGGTTPAEPSCHGFHVAKTEKRGLAWCVGHSPTGPWPLPVSIPLSIMHSEAARSPISSPHVLQWRPPPRFRAAFLFLVGPFPAPTPLFQLKSPL
jgi:hypothetical protein